MSLMKYILKEEQVFFRDIEAIKEYVIDKGIDLDEQLDYYIASGAYGDVYKVKNKNRVIKFHESYEEHQNANKIIEYQNNNKLKNVVNYLYSKKFDNHMYITVMEYLKSNDISINTYQSEIMKTLENIYLNNTPNNELIDLYERNIRIKFATSDDSIRNEIDILLDSIRKSFNDKIVFTMFVTVYHNTRHVTNEIVLQILKFFVSPKNKKFFEDIFNGIDELQMLGIKHGDIHRKNVLKDPKTGNYKLIDLG